MELWLEIGLHGRIASVPNWTRSELIAGKFRIERVVAKGATSDVMLATDVPLQRLVVIKALGVEHTGNPRAIARFAAEAIALRRVRHPNAVRIFEIGTDDDGRPFFAMEHVTGYDLRRVLQAEGPLTERRAVAIVCQVLSALQAAHAVGVIHRDLKPENVMLIQGRKDLVKVVDFGIALVDVGADGAEADGFGTRKYMAPEQRSGSSIDSRADVYATGVMAYELVTGRLPFGPLGRIRCSQELLRVLRIALADVPADRYASAEDFREALLQMGSRISMVY